MYERDLNNMLRIEGAEIWALNFSGRANPPYNREGDRNFCCEFDVELGDLLKEEGWNVKYHRDHDTDEPISAYINVSVNYKVGNPKLRPKIYVISGSKKTLLNEDTVGAVDGYDIVTNANGRMIADIEIRPRAWEMNDGKKGIKAYLSEMYITINESKFAQKYADFESDENPF